MRLSQSEVQQLAKQGSVQASTRFGAEESAVFHYQIRVVEMEEMLSAKNDAQSITVFINESTAQIWAEDDTRISVQSELPVAEDQSLVLLVEKDFKCLSPTRTEDESDLFPHPKEESVKC